MLSSRKIALYLYPFGMLAQNYNTKSYRFGFQNQEKDDEIYGIGNSINFKYRVTDTRLGRFWSIDPLASKYPHNSTYAFSENRVIDGIELEGLEVRIYTDKSALPHTFISIIDDDGVIHVFTYGQYNQAGQPWYGNGAMVHLYGSDANAYIQDEFKNYPMEVYELSDNLVNAQKVLTYFLKMKTPHSQNAAPPKKDAPNAINFVKNENSWAISYKMYALIPNDITTENCTSCTKDGIREGGVNRYNMDDVPNVPQFLNNALNKTSLTNPDIKNVTEEERKASQYNLNSEDISKSILSLPPFVIEETQTTANESSNSNP